MPIGLINLHMPKNELHTNPDDNKPMRNYAKFTGLAFQMIAIIGGFAYAGYKIDEYRGSKTPIITAAFSLVGVVLALYQVVKQLNKNNDS